ncbi:MAG: peptidylprolyl isomerase [Chloroflexota bacterium]
MKSQYGYHIIQIMHFPTDAQWADKLVAQASSLDVFKNLARDNSDDTESDKGGDMGWIGAHTYQVSDELATAIFAALIDKVSAVTSIKEDGARTSSGSPRRRTGRPPATRPRRSRPTRSAPGTRPSARSSRPGRTRRWSSSSTASGGSTERMLDALAGRGPAPLGS